MNARNVEDVTKQQSGTPDMAARGEHVIDQRDPCLACSHENFVLCSSEVGLVEYKCPHKASKDCLTLEQAAATLKGFWSVWN